MSTEFSSLKTMMNEGFTKNFHTSINLPNNPPGEMIVSDQNLLNFGKQLKMTREEIEHMNKVANGVMEMVIKPVVEEDRQSGSSSREKLSSSNTGGVIKTVSVSECHLWGSGRWADSGFDLVILCNPDVNLHLFNEKIRDKIVMNKLVPGTMKSYERPYFTHPTIHHMEYEGVPVFIGTGHCFDVNNEQNNRQIICQNIKMLDDKDELKKVHLDQAAIDLHQSTTIFMNHHAAPEELMSPLAGGETQQAGGGAMSASQIQNYEEFIQSALRLARAWRQCCLSRKDVKFASFDAWLVMLNAINTVVNRVHGAGTFTTATPTVGSISGIRKAVRDLFKRSKEQVAKELLMTDVLEEFLKQISQADTMVIEFNDFYDSSKIPEWIKSQRPLILDPTCPHRNTVFNLHKRVSEDLKKHALESMHVLNKSGSTLQQLFPLPIYKKKATGA